MDRQVNSVAAVGLAFGGVFGLLGSVVAQRNLQGAFWGLDGTALVVATVLLSLKYFRCGRDFVAGGFLVFAIGEGVMLTGSGGTLAASVPSFGAGTALWCAALLLISLPREFALWVRIVGILAAILFGITAAQIFWGLQVLPISKPLPFFAYPFLVVTFIGWIWTLLRAQRKRSAP